MAGGDLPHFIAGFTSFHSRRHAKENSRRTVGLEGEGVQSQKSDDAYNGGFLQWGIPKTMGFHSKMGCNFG